MSSDVSDPPVPARERSRIPGVVYVLALCVFALGTSEFMVAGILPDLAADLAVTIPEAGYLVSAFAIGMVVGAPLMAVLTLRLPRRTTLLAALAVVVAAHVLGALAPGYGVLLVSRVVAAVATGAFWAVAAVVTVSSVGPEARARALSVLLAGLTVANVIGVPLGTVLGQAQGWRAPFWGVAVLAVVGMGGVLLSVRGGTPDGPGPSLAAEVAVFRRGRVWLALLTTALYASGMVGAFSYVAPLLLEVTRVGPGAIPLILFGYGLGALAGILVGGQLADRYPWATLLGSLAGAAVLFVLVALFAAVAPVVVVLVLLLGVVSFVVAAPLNARVFALAGAAPTLASASNTAAFNVGNTIGPAVGGLAIAAGLGLTAPAWLAVAFSAAAIAGGVLSMRLDARAHRVPGQPPGR